MKYTLLLHLIYISLLPLAVELGTEVYRAKVLGRNDQHIWTALIRAGLVLWGSLTCEIEWYKALLVMITFHYLFFNYLFNKWAIEAHWSYLGSNFFDRLQAKLNAHVLLATKVVLFGLAVWYSMFNR